MSTPTITAARPTISPEVQEFAEREGVAEYLPKLLDLFCRLYPCATHLEVQLTDDPEIADDWHIVFVADAPMNVPQALEADRTWHDESVKLCPAPLRPVFRTSVYLRP